MIQKRKDINKSENNLEEIECENRNNKQYNYFKVEDPCTELKEEEKNDGIKPRNKSNPISCNNPYSSKSFNKPCKSYFGANIK